MDYHKMANPLSVPVIIGIGAIYQDTILTIPHFPEEDSKLRATSCDIRPGGNVPNTLSILSQDSNAFELVFIGVSGNREASR
jgi:hypothetical protein